MASAVVVLELVMMSESVGPESVVATLVTGVDVLATVVVLELVVL